MKSIYSICISVAVTLFLVPNITFADTQTFTSNGTFTVPAGVTSVTVNMSGGGGGGGCDENASGGEYFANGPGGGAGGTYIAREISVTPGAIIGVTVGSRGIGCALSPNGNSLGNQSAGGNSTFGGLVAGGGGFGYYDYEGIVFGGAGGFGSPTGGNGSSAGPGGSNFFGSGGSFGGAGTGYGGGGSGGYLNYYAGAGGAGAPGFVQVIYYPPVPGTINVSSNISGANWTITGPSTKTGSGTSASYGSMPVGTYTITWGAVGGYNAPGSNSQTLTSGGTINFSGSYTAIPPTTSFTASPASIAYNTASTLSWSSTNATGCTAGGAWSGAKATSGSVSTGNLTASQTYSLYCTGAGGNSGTQSVTVTVNPISDLTAGSVAPASATTGTATTFSATISNIGTASTGASFTNLFQFDSNADHAAVDATRTATAGPIVAGSSANASVSYTFPTAGDWYVRACADNNASWVGTITESNEGNNCGAWTNVAVTTPVPTGSITPSNCTITSGSTCTASISWTTSNVTSPSIRNNGIQFSAAPSSAGTPVTLNYGINTLTLYDGATWLDTKYASGFAADQGTTGSAHGGSFATAPTADLCTSGTASAVTVTGTGWTWTCGSGVGLVTGVAIRLGPVCGDNTCESGESLLTCPQDCKIKYQQF